MTFIFYVLSTVKIYHAIIWFFKYENDKSTLLKLSYCKMSEKNILYSIINEYHKMTIKNAPVPYLLPQAPSLHCMYDTADYMYAEYFQT